MLTQSIPIYLINIDRAAERLSEISRQSEELGLEIRRVNSVDGTLLDPGEWVNVDHARFKRRHGRAILAGEYGCYRSHLAALESFLANGDPSAIIIEDDVVLNTSFLDRAQSALSAVPRADVIKLVNHRRKGFRVYVRSSAGDHIGRCLFGPQGSTACYLVTRAGAQKMLRSLAVMSLPWDVAVERGWDANISIFATGVNLVEFGPLQRHTTIGRRRDYLSVKLNGWRRIHAHLFRTSDFFRRIAYVVAATL